MACERPLQRIPSWRGEDFELCFSFSTACWLQNYHYGVGKALQDCGVHSTKVHYSGASSGALAAACLVTEVDFESLKEYSCRCAVECRSTWLGPFRLKRYVGDGITSHIGENFTRKPVELKAAMNRQLEVFVTALPSCRSRVLTEFENVEELRQALFASCCLTPLCGFPFRLPMTGEWVCDGGFTSKQPREEIPGVIRVNPYSWSDAEIKPSVALPDLWSLYPPDDASYRGVYDRGYNDTVLYLTEKRLVPMSCRKLLRKESGMPRHTVASLLWEAFLFTEYTLIARPIVILLIYVELILSVLWDVVAGCLSFLLPHHRMRQVTSPWVHCQRRLCSLLSLQLLWHLVIPSGSEGKRVRATALGETSRLYRVAERRSILS